MLTSGPPRRRSKAAGPEGRGKREGKEQNEGTILQHQDSKGDGRKKEASQRKKKVRRTQKNRKQARERERERRQKECVNLVGVCEEPWLQGTPAAEGKGQAGV